MYKQNINLYCAVHILHLILLGPIRYFHNQSQICGNIGALEQNVFIQIVEIFSIYNESTIIFCHAIFKRVSRDCGKLY